MCMLLLSATWQAAQAESMTLNLRDADIASVIGTISEMTGRNFIVDPRVKGRVTVVSNRAMDEEELYQIFLSILNVHGFAAIPAGDAIKIVPAVNAKQDAQPLLGGEGDESVTRLIQVSNIEAAQLVPVLRPLLPQESHLAAYTPTNVLIVSSSAANVDKVAQMVREIDQAKDADIELIVLKHASATELERILSALQQAQGGKRADGSTTIQITSDERTNSLILSGEKAARQNIKRVIRQLDVPTDSGGNTRVLYLHYAKATDIANVLSSVGQSLAKEAAGGAQGARSTAESSFNIQADESSNSLVINAPPELMRDLEAVVRKLDVRRAQVMVKAVIAEVSTDSSRELGIMWGYDGSGQDEPVGLIDFNNTASGIAAALDGGSAPPSLNGMTLGIGETLSSGARFGALIRALGGDANNNILSTPTLVTLDNEEAEITVGQNVPFVTGSYTSTGGGSTPTDPFQTIQREDVGLTLKIKPQINEGNAVRMEVMQEVSSISGSSVGASDIITDKRALKTTVMVDDGQVLVLGGLLDDQLTESEQKVPLLGDIPVLGWLFRYQSTKTVKRDLMIFLHPRILRDGNHSTRLSNDKYSYIRARQLSMREEGVRLMPDEVSPLLPDMDEFLELPLPYGDETVEGSVLSQPPLAVTTPMTLD
ncbi:MAG: type II secretion system secretin GspD [Gammaproteobacteria bacterium]|nr:type II secretion system secretin GspD [Gammaproteobacteria bacterium]MCW8973545.1 type II secretion system secretin GspD [Gammaproteobacteria bacterium]MCW8993642.1 type II secretion system secretin GspD [Gammaproteobacteria bacterium]